MDIVKSSGESVKIHNDNCEFDLEKLKTSTLNKLDAYVKRVLTSRVKPGRSETEDRRDRRCLERSKRVGHSPARGNTESSEKKRTPSESERYVHPDDHEHYICPAMKRLRSEVCFVCGYFGKMYNLNDTLRKSFETRFGSRIQIEYYTPNRLCGSCRAILLADDRQFKFREPMQWAAGSNHLVYESNCDCYFCKANANPEFFRTKTRENLPTNTTSILPELIDGTEADKDEHRFENVNQSVFPNQKWTTAGHQNAKVGTSQCDQTNSAQAHHTGSSTNGCCTAEQLRNEMRDELVRIKNDMLFICNQMDKKKLDIGDLHKDLEEIKNQQKVILNKVNLTNFLLLPKSQQILPPDDQFENSLED